LNVTPGPAQAAALVQTVLSVTDPPRPTRQVLLDITISQGWAAGADAEDKADMWLNRFKRRLAFIIAEAVEEGEYRSFTFNSSGDDYLQGYCFCEPGESDATTDAKRKRAYTIEVFEHIARLSDRDFEILSGKVIELLGVERAYVSRISGDQGIDFYGRARFSDILRPPLIDAGAEKNLYVWLIGQSKHYPRSQVSTQEIRELVGSVELAKVKIYAGGNDPLEHLKIRLCDPVFFLFFTSGRFTRDSKDVLRRAGISAFNGLQIAQFLADQGIGLNEQGFDPPTFQVWLQGLK
jgi:hypothetical protein